MFYLNKKTTIAYIFLTLWVYITPSFAQNTDAWTGSVVGSTIHFGNNDTLKYIRTLLNEGKTVAAAREAQKLVDGVMNNERSGEVSAIQYDAYNALCISLTANNQYDEALDACTTAIEHSPRRWQAINSRGSLNYKIGRYTDALADYRMALERSPNQKNIRRIVEHNIQISEARINGS